MRTISTTSVRKAVISLGSATVLMITLTGCMSAEEQRRANLYEDGSTCSDFGARYGSGDHTGCMLEQQRRRDQEQLLAMERARISSETARNNMETLRLMRERRHR